MAKTTRRVKILEKNAVYYPTPKALHGATGSVLPADDSDGSLILVRLDDAVAKATGRPTYWAFESELETIEAST